VFRRKGQLFLVDRTFSRAHHHDTMAMTSQVRLEEARKTDSYQLVVFNHAGTAVLLEAQPLGYDLPLVEIPKFTRPARELTSHLRGSWQAPSTLLFAGLMEQDRTRVYFAALEAQESAEILPNGIDWFPIDHAILHILKGKARDVLESCHLKATNRGAADDLEPFSKLGWMRNLRDWVTPIIGPLSMDLRDFEHLNGSETFSLIRFDTTKLPVWFKAVGKPNLHELPITVALAELFPEYLPSLLATRPACHGWLMADADGLPLREVEDAPAWKAAATALAGLQIASIGAIDNLLEAGCKDLRARTLLELVDPFLEVIGDLMQQQTKVPPAILSWQELSDLGATLKNALCCLKSLGIPDTLGHSDFNPGNILVGSHRCVFIDWAEAHVSYPFLTFEYLVSHLRKDYPTLTPFEDTIRSSYTQRWQSISLSGHVSEAFLFSPLVAVFAYAVAGNSWRDPERLKFPQVPGYLRSLTRRMKREADSVQRRRVECIN
jgi:phosphotransferase family enzyme